MGYRYIPAPKGVPFTEIRDLPSTTLSNGTVTIVNLPVYNTDWVELQLHSTDLCYINLTTDSLNRHLWDRSYGIYSGSSKIYFLTKGVPMNVGLEYGSHNLNISMTSLLPGTPVTVTGRVTMYGLRRE